MSDYKQDFSHHIPPTIRPQVTKLWDSIPRQLAKENKKFVYSEIENTKARVKEYDPALEWLKDSGLVYQIMRLSKPALPIKAYQEYNSFKIIYVGYRFAVCKIRSRYTNIIRRIKSFYLNLRVQ